ncbi:hypothetical protein A9Q84_17210 [Halobacteriovorax marinus]|uniref:Zinc finger DksA/TraR C4-type domain-containing protein n=1 Tax=Halobacteriovorax marinus TaxID=97084 RepID=A0A1Y5F9F0_9BACT|nr:hypothetical protein A9Q84_17210 [Halobacteriovorax marinus]
MSGKNFDNSFLKKQKEALLHLKTSILNHMRTHSIDDLQPDRDEVVEEVDQSQISMSQQMSMELRERELKRLHEVEEALYRIDEGIYGLCEESGEPIGKKRLEKLPWVRLSIEAQEEEERHLRAA